MRAVTPMWRRRRLQRPDRAMSADPIREDAELRLARLEASAGLRDDDEAPTMSDDEALRRLARLEAQADIKRAGG